MQANQTARPWGLHGPTPDQAWRRHRPVGGQERITFTATVRRLEMEIEVPGHEAAGSAAAEARRRPPSAGRW